MSMGSVLNFLTFNDSMKIALAQFNPIVGDIAGNAKRHLEMILDAFSKRVNLVVFPGIEHHWIPAA